MTRHFLEIDDLSAAELVDRARPRRGADRPRAEGARRPGRRVALREAVGAHAQLDRDGRRAARRAPGHDPRRRGRPRHPRDRRGRHPHPRLLPLGDRGAGVRALEARADGCGVVRAGRQPAVRPHPPDAGAGRPPHDPPGLRRAVGSHARVRRRRQQRRPVARARGAPGRDEGARRVALRLRAARAPTPSSRPTPSPRSPVPMSSTPTCGRRWARRTKPQIAVGRSPASSSTTRSWRAPRPTRSSSTASRRTASMEVATIGHRRSAFPRVAAGGEPDARRPGAARRSCSS